MLSVSNLMDASDMLSITQEYFVVFKFLKMTWHEIDITVI